MLLGNYIIFAQQVMNVTFTYQRDQWCCFNFIRYKDIKNNTF